MDVNGGKEWKYKGAVGRKAHPGESQPRLRQIMLTRQFPRYIGGAAHSPPDSFLYFSRSFGGDSASLSAPPARTRGDGRILWQAGLPNVLGDGKPRRKVLVWAKPCPGSGNGRNIVGILGRNSKPTRRMTAPIMTDY